MSVENVIKLKDKEQILGVIRQFPVVIVGPMALAMLVFAAPFFLMVPLFRFGPKGVVAFFALMVAGALLAARAFIRWYWTVFIITNRRVVDVDQRGFFDRFVSEAAYEKVQDVCYSRKGFWGTVLNFGTLVVQTAGTSAHLEQYFVRHPQDTQHLIVEAMSAYLSAPSGEVNGKVSALLEAAASLSNAEARAFLSEIKGAVDKTEDESEVSEGDVEQFLADSLEESEDNGDFLDQGGDGEEGRT